MKPLTLPVAALSALVCLAEVHAEGPFERELGFCETISTPMPDPRASSFYVALPTSTGRIAGAGWSGHVKAWFNFMRDGNVGAVKQYLAHDERLSRTAQEYRQLVIGEGGKLVKETEKSAFKGSVRDFNTRKNSHVVRLVNQYVNESNEVARKYKELRGAILEVKATKEDLVSVRDEYEAFLKEMQYKDLDKEKRRLLSEAMSVSQTVTTVIDSMANIYTAIPFDATSIMGLLKGNPITSIVKLAFGPDPSKLAKLDAQLEALDREIKEHKDRAFRSKIQAARLRLEKNELVASSSAQEILSHKLKTWQAISELAGLESERGSFQFFHVLRDYYKAVALKAAALNEAVNSYYQFLTTTRLDEGEILVKHIEVDVAHVRQYNLDPTGEWMKFATEAASWLEKDYLPWYRAEVERVGACITGFKELRHFHLVNKSVNLVIEATGGIPQPELGKYLF